MAKTPHWALFGASERGFDPKDIRYQRKNKSKDISGCWNYLNLGYWRTKTDAPEGSQIPLWFFPRINYTNCISYTRDYEAGHGNASHVLGLEK